jgi:hypothetical protein
MTEINVVESKGSAGQPVRYVYCGDALVVLAPTHPEEFSLAEGEWLPRSEIPNMIAALQKAEELFAEETA